MNKNVNLIIKIIPMHCRKEDNFIKTNELTKYTNQVIMLQLSIII